MPSPVKIRNAFVVAALAGLTGLVNSPAISAQTADVTDCDRYAASDFDKQSRAPGVPFNRIDVAKAIPACQDAIAASPDDPRIVYQLGRAHDANRDYSKAIVFFQNPPTPISPSGQVNLGSLYFNGQGVARDYGEAAKWDRRAAGQGLAPAQANLGLMYIRGQGVDVDYVEGLRRLRLAADQNFAPALNALGDLFAEGTGVNQNYAASGETVSRGGGPGLCAGRGQSWRALRQRARGRAKLRRGDALVWPRRRSRQFCRATGPRSAARRQRARPRPIAFGAAKGRAARAGVFAQDRGQWSLCRSARRGRISARQNHRQPPGQQGAGRRRDGDDRGLSGLPGFLDGEFFGQPGRLPGLRREPRRAAGGKFSWIGLRFPPDTGRTPAELAKISLSRPPFEPPIVASLGQYMTFYVDPSVCEVREVEVLVNGFEWTWTPG